MQVPSVAASTEQRTQEDRSDRVPVEVVVHDVTSTCRTSSTGNMKAHRSDHCRNLG
jgi:hypothetical protein